VNIEKRVKKTKEVRLDGFIPGVIYGKDFTATSVQVPKLEFEKTVQKYGTSKTFSILLDDKKHIVYIKDFQNAYMDPSSYIHFDLVKVSADDTLQSNVTLHFIGKEVYTKSSLVFTTILDEIEVEYQVGSGVSYIDVDVSALTEEEPIHVKDIILPKGIKVLNDPEQMVCSLSRATFVEEVVESDEQEGLYVAPETEE
jgi:large subunit ribosomal protein L25